MRPLALIPALLVLLWAKSATAQDVVERDDWAHLFADAGVTGTIVIVDERPEESIARAILREIGALERAG